MEFSPEMMTDIALNAVGYLAAGALSVVIYVLFTGRGHRRDGQAVVPAPAFESDASHPNRSTGGGRSVEFVRLSQQRREETTPAFAERRRNRVEVIARARQMLDDGMPASKIKQSLPISDAELALLTYENE
jgi:hypothetical protein